MRITALLTYFLILMGSFDLLFTGVLGFSVSGLVLGVGSFWQRLFYCFVGVSGIFYAFFGAIYKPFKSLAK